MFVSVFNRTTNRFVAERAGLANTSESRRRGLLKHTGLQPGEGLWIVPCEAVHCFFMRFSIDIVFLDRRRRVVKLSPSVRPWRIAVCLKAHSVLELPEGQIESAGLRVGDELEIVKLQPAPEPQGLAASAQR